MYTLQFLKPLFSISDKCKLYGNYDEYIKNFFYFFLQKFHTKNSYTKVKWLSMCPLLIFNLKFKIRVIFNFRLKIATYLQNVFRVIFLAPSTRQRCKQFLTDYEGIDDIGYSKNWRGQKNFLTKCLTDIIKVSRNVWRCQKLSDHQTPGNPWFS